MLVPVAAIRVLLVVRGPRTLAVLVSVVYVIRCTVDIRPAPGELLPPPNHPYVVPSPDAANEPDVKLNGPLLDAVSVSVVYVMRDTALVVPSVT